MKIQLSDHFTYKRLIRFVFPSIIMMICTSMYSIVDGLFVSNFAGKTAFAAVNLILPVSMGVGADGVAAYGVIMYANFIFAAIYLGYSMGSAPITSYNYGAGNHTELKNMLKKSLSLITVTGVCLTLISEFFAHPLINVFVGYDADLFTMTLHGFRLYALVFLINGFNIWASSFFTALNNGVISGIPSAKLLSVLQSHLPVYVLLILTESLVYY